MGVAGKGVAAPVPGDAGRSALDAERAATVARLAALHAEVEGIVEASRDANLDDECDPEGATVAFERQRVAALEAEARAHLAAIDAAEARLAGGGYGVCADCGGPIGAERLEALPTTTRCVACAARR
ncbi:MAG TPA: TraR/DksA C4-type zinc finger protein [Acidimicrobiales bacterium]|nr:TraR/DksA C4-type zinc finger protein [Acidimicrobiales bacterium]